MQTFDSVKKFHCIADVSPNTNGAKVADACEKAVEAELRKLHDRQLKMRNLFLDLTLWSYDTLYNSGEFLAKSYEIRKAIERRGYPSPVISTRHKKSEKDLYIEIDGSFEEVMPWE